MAAQFAINMNCEVWVTSGSNWKIQEAVNMGAAGGKNYKEKDWAKEMKKQGDLLKNGEII